MTVASFRAKLEAKVMQALQRVPSISRIRRPQHTRTYFIHHSCTKINGARICFGLICKTKSAASHKIPVQSSANRRRARIFEYHFSSTRFIQDHLVKFSLQYVQCNIHLQYRIFVFLLPELRLPDNILAQRLWNQHIVGRGGCVEDKPGVQLHMENISSFESDMDASVSSKT